MVCVINRSLTLLVFSVMAYGALYVGPVNAAVLDKAREVGLRPHRALYDVKLLKAKNGTQIVNISGKMVYEWQPSCDAWISHSKFELSYDYADAPPVRVQSDFSTHESFDNKTITFNTNRRSNGQVFEEFRGSAGLGDTPAAGGKAVYTLPADLKFDLPEGAVFPMSHTLSVLDQIKTGKKFRSVVTFDGSDKEGPVQINSFIGKAATVPEKLKSVKDIDQAALNSKAWNLRMAFFPINSQEEKADYEMDMIFHENGVVSDMVIDYGDFAVSQTLTALETLGDACGSEENTSKKPDGKDNTQEH